MNKNMEDSFLDVSMFYMAGHGPRLSITHFDLNSGYWNNSNIINEMKRTNCRSVRRQSILKWKMMFADMELNRTSPPRPQSHLKSKKVPGNWLGGMFLIHYWYIWKTTFKYWDDSALGKKNLFSSLFHFFRLALQPPWNDSFVDGPEMRLSFLQIAALSNTKKKKWNVILEGDKSALSFESVRMFVSPRWSV